MKSGLKVLRFLKPYWRWVLLAPLLMLMEAGLDLIQPRLVQRIVDEGIARLNLPVVIHTLLLMIGLAVLGSLCGGSNGILAAKSVQAFGADLRESLFRKVQTLSFGNLDELGTGQLTTRLTSDVFQLQEAIHVLLRFLARAPLLLMGSLVMAVVTCRQLAFLPLILLPVELAFAVWIIKKATPMYTLVQERLDVLNGVMQENLAGVRVIKAFAQSAHEQARFGTHNDNLMERTLRAARTAALTQPFTMLTMNLGVVSALWFGGLQVSRGAMQVGQIIAFVNYLVITLFSLMMMSMVVPQMARALASAERVLELFEIQPKVQDRADARTGFIPQGRVAFEKVSFSYNGNGNDPVLQDVSLVAEPGQTIALLGSTGVGKSSLVHLIPRFYDVTAGRVTIDGVDVRQMEQAALRRHIGIVLQETVLLSGTIRDNIRYGRPGASDSEVITASQAAQAHDFIMAFPDGYDTVLGQRGVNLSGGQKQRIAIARALLLQPAVLILDDSTSAVDVETESRIQAALKERMGCSTRLVIAQRISTVLEADKILLLAEGRITAEGTHSQLLASSPIYQALYESQLGGEDICE
jgi:ATP-binding cassette subfamily B multidrug efflux pump